MNYNNYRYIFPPRPQNAMPPKDINRFDNGAMLAQPKMNGSNCLIFTDGEHINVMNRHGQNLTNFLLDKEEILNMYNGTGWMIINGEYLNKSKRDENGVVFNHKLVIFDLLVHNGKYLVGKTFEERVNLLSGIYGTNKSEKDYLYKYSDNVYCVKTYYDNFECIFNELIKIDVIEGLVCKRKSAKLELGTTSTNNTKSQIKFRKPTKSYRF
jgi:ATP-dependent DNA ligase